MIGSSSPSAAGSSGRTSRAWPSMRSTWIPTTARPGSTAIIQALPGRPEAPGLFTVVVVGAGLTGLETATEMPGRLRTVLARAGRAGPLRVILADHHPWVGSDMGESARPVIEEALAALGIETRLGIDVASISPSGVTLKSGEEIPAATVVWCAGMRANPLTRLFPVEPDRFGRIPVDEFMRVKGVANVFAAGDAAWSHDGRPPCVGHVLSARPADGAIRRAQRGLRSLRPADAPAAHRVVCDRAGPGGVGGPLYRGMGPAVVTTGEAAKKTKQVINGHRIYPPLTRDRREILAAAAPVVQRPPEIQH